MIGTIGRCDGGRGAGREPLRRAFEFVANCARFRLWLVEARLADDTISRTATDSGLREFGEAGSLRDQFEGRTVKPRPRARSAASPD